MASLHIHVIDAYIRKAFLRPRTTKTKTFRSVSCLPFALLPRLPILSNSDPLRFRPGYSGGAAPDFHRIPEHRNFFLFDGIIACHKFVYIFSCTQHGTRCTHVDRVFKK